MSDKEAHVVDNRDMAAVNLQYLTAVMVLDRTVSFASAHDDGRVGDPAVAAIKARVLLQPDPALPRRKPAIEIRTHDGRSLEHRTRAVRGTPGQSDGSTRGRGQSNGFACPAAGRSEGASADRSRVANRRSRGCARDANSPTTGLTGN